MKTSNVPYDITLERKKESELLQNNREIRAENLEKRKLGIGAIKFIVGVSGIVFAVSYIAFIILGHMGIDSSVLIRPMEIYLGLMGATIMFLAGFAKGAD